MFKVIDCIEAAHIMKEVTRAIDRNVFDRNGTGLLIIKVADYIVTYELLDGDHMEKWLLDNTPCCGNREHIGWACDKDGCIPF